MSRYYIFIFLSFILLLPSCMQNEASVFYEKVNAIYAESNGKIYAALAEKEKPEKILKLGYDKCIKEMNDLPYFKDGENLKKAMMAEIVLWEKIADLSDKINNDKLSTLEMAALSRERLNLQTSRMPINEHVNEENAKFAEKFHLKPLNTFVKIKQRNSKD